MNPIETPPLRAMSINDIVLAFNDAHQQAMSCADDGDQARRAGDETSAQVHYARALEMERDVAVAEQTQPSRGILLRSAAWLALDANQPEEALRLARLGLADADVPERYRTQLQEVAAAAQEALSPQDTP